MNERGWPQVPSDGGDWLNLRKCDVCQRQSGMACIARSGHVVGGRPDGVIVKLAAPHHGRRRRAGR